MIGLLIILLASLPSHPYCDEIKDVVLEAVEQKTLSMSEAIKIIQSCRKSTFD
jgi:hypothetical protein